MRTRCSSCCAFSLASPSHAPFPAAQHLSLASHAARLGVCAALGRHGSAMRELCAAERQRQRLRRTACLVGRVGGHRRQHQHGVGGFCNGTCQALCRLRAKRSSATDAAFLGNHARRAQALRCWQQATLAVSCAAFSTRWWRKALRGHGNAAVRSAWLSSRAPVCKRLLQQLTRCAARCMHAAPPWDSRSERLSYVSHDISSGGEAWPARARRRVAR